MSGSYEDLLNDLTPKVKVDASLTFLWYDLNTSVVDGSLNERIIIADTSGPLTLTHVSGTTFKYTYESSVKGIYTDLVFTDQDDEDFYTSYVEKYQSSTNTETDDDLNIEFTHNSGTDCITIDTSTSDVVDILFDLGAMSSMSETNQNIVFDVSLSTDFDYLTTINTSITSTFTVNLDHYDRGFTFDTLPELYVGDTNRVLSLTANTLTSNALLTFVTDASSNANLTTLPLPSFFCSTLVPSSYSEISFGSQTLEIPLTMPLLSTNLKTGSWNWTVTLTDGTFTQSKSLRLTIVPYFKTPAITGSALNISGATSSTTDYTVSYNANDISDSDVLAAGDFMEVRTNIADLSNNILSSGHEIFDVLSLDTSVNNLPVISSSLATVTFTLTYNGSAHLIQTAGSYNVLIQWRPNNSTDWNNVTYLLTVTPTYFESISLINNYNGTYNVSVPTLETNHVVRLSTDSGSGSTFSTLTDTSNYEFSVATNTSYYVQIYDTSETNVYYQTSTITMNDYLYASINFSTDTSSNFAEGLTNDGFGYSGSFEPTASNSVTIPNTLSEYSFNITSNNPSWASDISDAKLYTYITESPVYDPSSYVFTNVVPSHTDFSTSYHTNNLTSNATINSSIDLSFNTTRSNASYITVFAQWKSNGGVIYSSNFVSLYVRPTTSSFAGNNFNNMIIHNTCLINLTTTTLGNMYTVLDPSFNELSDTSLNTWNNIAIRDGNLHNITLGRTQFMNSESGHSVYRENNTVSDMTFDASGNSVGISPFISGDISDIYIDLGYFAGHVDITYYDSYKGVKSLNTNKLRLFVMPRPKIIYTILDPTSSLVSAALPTSLYQSVTNKQMYNNEQILFSGAKYGLLENGTVSSYNISYLFDDYLSAIWVSRTVNNDNELFSSNDTSTNTLIDSTDVILRYGDVVNGYLDYAGKTIDGDELINYNVNYDGIITFKRKKHGLSYTNVSYTASFVLTFINDPDYQLLGQLNTINLSVDNELSVNDFSIIKYLTTSSDVDLTTGFTHNLYVIVRNQYLLPITITYSAAKTISLPFGNQAVFLRTNQSSWSYIFIS